MLQTPSAVKSRDPEAPDPLIMMRLGNTVADFPVATQNERATHFGVSRHCIWYGLKQLNITRKKSVKRT